MCIQIYIYITHVHSIKGEKNTFKPWPPAAKSQQSFEERSAERRSAGYEATMAPGFQRLLHQSSG